MSSTTRTRVSITIVSVVETILSIMCSNNSIVCCTKRFSARVSELSQYSTASTMNKEVIPVDLYRLMALCKMSLGCHLVDVESS